MRDGHYLELTFANHLPEENLLHKNRGLLFFYCQVCQVFIMVSVRSIVRLYITGLDIFQTFLSQNKYYLISTFYLLTILSANICLTDQKISVLVSYYLSLSHRHQSEFIFLELTIPHSPVWLLVSNCGPGAWLLCNVTASGHGDLVTAVTIMFRVLSSPATDWSCSWLTDPHRATNKELSNPSTGAMLQSRKKLYFGSV